MSQIAVNGERLSVDTKRQYPNGRMAVQLLDGQGHSYATLSVNLPDAPELLADEFYAKTWSENAPLRQPALSSGLFEDTGRRVRTGFVEAEVWKLRIALHSPARRAVALIAGILETISEEPLGVPSGVLYTLWMAQGGTLTTYTSMMSNLVGAGWLRCSNNLYFITPKGQELVARLKA